jgi:hypothetical protein
MSSGIYNLKRDFQVSEQMEWHKLTRVGKPKLEDFPEIKPMPLFYNEGNPMVFGNRKFVVPVAMDDMLPVAPPYCGETIIDVEENGCEAKEKDKRGTYILFTPREAWAWVCEVLAGTEYNVKSIGMLWNRSFWFISVELTELKSLQCGDDRKTDFMLNFSGGLDRSVSPQCELSSIVAVCHNTISLSRSSGKILFHERATKHFTDRKEAAINQVGEAVGMAAVFKASMDALAKQACDAERAERIMAGYITPLVDAKGKPIVKMSTRGVNTVKTLKNLHVNGIGNNGNTEFDLLNAYTELLTHGTAEMKIPFGRRFASSEFGNNADSKAEFYNLLTNRKMAVDSEEFGDWMTVDEFESRGEKLLAAI